MPAWTDRILYWHRLDPDADGGKCDGSNDQVVALDSSSGGVVPLDVGSLDCGNNHSKRTRKWLELEQYTSLETLVESDHRPVFATFSMDAASGGDMGQTHSSNAANVANRSGNVVIVRENRRCSGSALCVVQ